ncbi:thylakoid lumenal 17.9 kDa protein, chloroplastic [Aristolochia californica]|uniref:thylakoid lumenal 17.9 kDa protein, chloroplastic n=1 Tax=Aristolochia californica TaxID=171875 RepID=UPI0035D832F3
MPRTLCLLQSSALLPISCSTVSAPESSSPFRNQDFKGFFSSKLASVVIALTVTSAVPSLAIPSLNSPSLSPATPFSQSQNLQIGLENGKIRPCPATNPGCISTNPKSSSFAFPWEIPESASGTAVQKLREAILKTQANVKIQALEDTPDGQYLQAEVDGSFGRDVLEFLVKKEVASYRCMATKVTYVYPFTTAIGDSRGQKERLKRIVDQLGWIEPNFEFMD